MDRAADGGLGDIEFGGNAEEVAPAEAQGVDPKGDVAFCRGLIQELAQIAKELAKRGVDPLVTREQEIRATLKAHMLDCHLDRVPDPKTMLAARLQFGFSDIYDLEALEPLLTKAQQKKCLVVGVDGSAVKKLVETGVLEYDELVEKGALTRKPRSPGLYIDRMKE